MTSCMVAHMWEKLLLLVLPGQCQGWELPLCLHPGRILHECNALGTGHVQRLGMWDPAGWMPWCQRCQCSLPTHSLRASSFLECPGRGDLYITLLHSHFHAMADWVNIWSWNLTLKFGVWDPEDLTQIESGRPWINERVEFWKFWLWKGEEKR